MVGSTTLVRLVQVALPMKLAASLALLASLSGACTMTASGRRAAMWTGAGAVVTGFLVGRSGANDSDMNGVNDTLLNDDLGTYLLGTALILGGVALFLGGTASTVEADPVSPVGPAVAPVPYQTPTIQLAPLPELPVTEEVWNLARRIRTDTAQGRCEAAWALWREVARLDTAYAVAMRDGPVMAPCPPGVQTM